MHACQPCGRGYRTAAFHLATAETDQKPTVFTERDRELLSEIHAFLVRLDPLIKFAEKWVDKNPAAKWRQRHG